VANQSKGAAAKQSRENPPFEEALKKKLEGIVEAMESDDLPLKTFVEIREGSKLVKICRKNWRSGFEIHQLRKMRRAK